MRNGNYEQQTVDQVRERVPGAARTLRAYGIDPTNRLTLAQAAAAVSATPDEILAVMEDRARRAAQKQAARRHAVEAHEEEFELAY